MNIKSILVPTDFSKHAISAGAYAIWLADNYQAKVRFLHVVQPETGDLDIPVISAKGTIDRVEAAREVLEAYTGAVDARLRSMYQPRNSIETSTEVIVGAPGSEVPRILSRDVDLCVIGTRGEHNRLDHIFGSVTTNVISKARVPVYVVPAEIDHLSISGAGYATELDLCDPLLIWRLSKLMKPFNPLISIVHVHASDDDKHETTLAEMREFLEHSIPLRLAFYSVKGSNVGEQLRNFGKRHDLDLLVLHRQRRSWVERLLHPSVSRNMALESDIPLLVIQ